MLGALPDVVRAGTFDLSIDLHLAKHARRAAEGDSAAFPAMVRALEFAYDVGRGGTVSDKDLEQRFRYEILQPLFSVGHLSSVSPSSLRDGLLAMDDLERRVSSFVHAVEGSHTGAKIAPAGEDLQDAIPVAKLADMPALEAADLIEAVLDGQGEAVQITPRDLSTLNRIMLRRADWDMCIFVIRARLASRIFRAERGHSPAVVSDLVPAYLDEAARDPFTGESLVSIPIDRLSGLRSSAHIDAINRAAARERAEQAKARAGGSH